MSLLMKDYSQDYQIVYDNIKQTLLNFKKLKATYAFYECRDQDNIKQWVTSLTTNKYTIEVSPAEYLIKIYKDNITYNIQLVANGITEVHIISPNKNINIIGQSKEIRWLYNEITSFVVDYIKQDIQNVADKMIYGDVTFYGNNCFEQEYPFENSFVYYDKNINKTWPIGKIVGDPDLKKYKTILDSLSSYTINIYVYSWKKNIININKQEDLNSLYSKLI